MEQYDYDTKKAKILAKFQELKSHGNKITLNDCLDEEDKEFYKSRFIKEPEPEQDWLEIEDIDLKYLNKFYKKANKLKKENLSDIKVISTSEGKYFGFTYTENEKEIKIFLMGQDVITEDESGVHELGLCELN
jgi:hypothetical protein